MRIDSGKPVYYAHWLTNVRNELAFPECKWKRKEIWIELFYDRACEQAFVTASQLPFLIHSGLATQVPPTANTLGSFR